MLRKKITTKSSEHWVGILRKNGMWCEKVFNYNDLNNQPFMNDLQLKQTVRNSEGKEMITTRLPIQFNGDILTSTKAAPQVGEDNEKIYQQFLND
ncbi:CoA transferase [Thalassobellus suaedae]|uniref:CoA transferase n=1 Tax=Thalassobellus suaedae TaxID=3074124 RepID=A0ABY9XYT9_9FLAO|nr:CoA transferase [Flavobacteriaceae bacterium HL-DH14]